MDNNDIKLAIYYDASGTKVEITVTDYLKFILYKDKKSITSFLYNRLHSRYLNPFEDNKRKDGFSMMANYCLLIETIQSFKNGWGDSNRKSKMAFTQFFTDNEEFKELNDKGAEIYTHIRCGILHQGETTNGWRISRQGIDLVNEEQKIIDAFLFGKKLKEHLNNYKLTLESKDWDSEEWGNLRKKMETVIENTKIT
jgi:hypothetical protein